MEPNPAPDAVRLHARIVLIAGLAGVIPLAIFRALIELGLSPVGSLWILSVPLEYLCIAWFLGLLALGCERRRLSGDARVRVTAYEWTLGILGVAGVIWLMRELGTYRFVVGEAWVYAFACACMIVIFLSAATVERPRGLKILRNTVTDVVRILGRPATWACALLALAVIGAGPRSSDIPSGGAAFRRWYARQPRQTIPSAWAIRPVTLVEVTDYQCPVCKQAAATYRDVLTQATRKYSGLFGFVRVDFPLEAECNRAGGPGATGGLHPAACEAAAAVRVAREHGEQREHEVIDWLFRNQTRLTREMIFEEVESAFGLNVRERYAELVPQITAEAAEARRLQVTGTPTYFLNGRRLSLINPETLQAAIELEMQTLASAGR